MRVERGVVGVVESAAWFLRSRSELSCPEATGKSAASSPDISIRRVML